MSPGVVLRASVVVFAAALLQAVLASSLVVGGGAPDVLLLVVISFGLLRGSVAGASVGFAGGLLVDLLTLDTLGLTSLILTLAGFWAGRYGETTARGRHLPPVLAAGVITVLVAVFAFLLRYLLGEAVVAQQALVTALAPTLMLNLALALPVHALVRAAVHERADIASSSEVEVVV
ncbi:MAG TPA: rod shape-determining protein MreD [Gaiellaceae bacterium]|nr:rod shape-determining protein MreD [Gaiellaceae bacterium]